LSTLTLEDEDINFNGKDELSENDHLLECLVDDFLYIPVEDQDLYFYFNDENDVWFMFFLY